MSHLAQPRESIRFPYRPRAIKAESACPIASTRRSSSPARPRKAWAPETLSDEREITKSIRQKSHIRLSDGEAATALKAFGVKNGS